MTMSGSSSAGSTWRPLRGLDQRRLSDTRRQAHQALQWLARAARAYLQPRPDDGHTSLGWIDALNGLVTHPLEDGTRLWLDVADFTLSWGDDKDAVSFILSDRTDDQVRQWLGEQAAKRGLDADALDAPAPYALPLDVLARGGTYDAVSFSDGFAELAAWFTNADISLDRIRADITKRELDVSEVRCWPHHFDLAILISFPARNGETGYIGAGLSPGDEYYDEPYFYVSVYPRPDTATLPKPPELGHWHTHEFTAAVAPAHRTLAAENREATTDQFLSSAVSQTILILR